MQMRRLVSVWLAVCMLAVLLLPAAAEQSPSATSVAGDAGSSVNSAVSTVDTAMFPVEGFEGFTAGTDNTLTSLFADGKGKEITAAYNHTAGGVHSLRLPMDAPYSGTYARLPLRVNGAAITATRGDGYAVTFYVRSDVDGAFTYALGTVSELAYLDMLADTAITAAEKRGTVSLKAGQWTKVTLLAGNLQGPADTEKGESFYLTLGGGFAVGNSDASIYLDDISAVPLQQWLDAQPVLPQVTVGGLYYSAEANSAVYTVGGTEYTAMRVYADYLCAEGDLATVRYENMVWSIAERGILFGDEDDGLVYGNMDTYINQTSVTGNFHSCWDYDEATDRVRYSMLVQNLSLEKCATRFSYRTYMRVNIDGGTYLLYSRIGRNLSAQALYDNRDKTEYPDLGWYSALDGEEPAQTETIPAALKGKTVLFADWGEASAEEYQKVVKKFTADTGIKVKVLVYSSADYISKVSQQIAAGSSPDIVVCNSTFPQALEVVQPLPSYFNVHDGFWDHRVSAATKVGGKYYFVNTYNSPFTGGYMVYYNKKIYNNNGLTSPQDYLDQGQWSYETLFQCMTDAVKLGYKGGMIEPLPLAEQMGVSLIDYDRATGTFTGKTTDPTLVKSMQYMSKAVDEGLVGGSTAGFNNGLVGICMLGIYGLKYDGYFKDLAPSDIGVVPPPTSYDGQELPYMPMGYRGYGICKGAKNIEAAYYFLRYFLDLDKYEPAGANIFANKVMEKYYKQTHLVNYQQSDLFYEFFQGALSLINKPWGTSDWTAIRHAASSQVAVELAKMQNVVDSAAAAATAKVKEYASGSTVDPNPDDMTPMTPVKDHVDYDGNGSAAGETGPEVYYPVIPLLDGFDSRFTIVRSFDSADNGAWQIAAELRQTMGQVLNAEVAMHNESHAETTYEIIIGTMSERPLSTSIYDEIVNYRPDHANDYIIRMVGTKLYINAANAISLENAVQHFLAKFCTSDNGAIPKHYEYIHRPEHKPVMLDGQNIANYTIRTERNPSLVIRKAAEAIQTYVRDTCGYNIEIRKMGIDADDHVSNEIRIGPMNGNVKVDRVLDTAFDYTTEKTVGQLQIDEDGYIPGDLGYYEVGFEGKNLIVNGGSDYACNVAVNRLLTELTETDKLDATYTAQGNYTSGYDYFTKGKYDTVNFDMTGGYGLVLQDNFDFETSHEETEKSVRSRWTVNTDQGKGCDPETEMQWRPGYYGENWWVTTDSQGNGYLMEITKRAYRQKNFHNNQGEVMPGYDAVRLVSANKFGWRYGISETRLVMGCRNGACSAVWYASSGYPGSQPGGISNEFDLYENYGRELLVPNSYANHATHTTMATRHGQTLGWVEPREGEHFYDTFHHVTMEWDFNMIHYYLDGEPYCQIPLNDANVHAPFRIGTTWKLANGVGSGYYTALLPDLSSGGPTYNPVDFMGEENLDKFFEVQIVDYIRLYQTTNDGKAGSAQNQFVHIGTFDSYHKPTQE